MRHIRFDEAYFEMLRGNKIARPCFQGYWYINGVNGKLTIHLANGEEIVEGDLSLTITNVLAEDWYVIYESYGDECAACGGTCDCDYYWADAGDGCCECCGKDEFDLEVGPDNSVWVTPDKDCCTDLSDYSEREHSISSDESTETLAIYNTLNSSRTEESVSDRNDIDKLEDKQISEKINEKKVLLG